MQKTISELSPVLIAIMGGALCTVFSLSPLFIPVLGFLLSYFAALPLYMVGFGWGKSNGAIACLVPFLLFFLALGPNQAGLFAIMNVIPTILIVHLSLRQNSDQQWYPLGHVISWLVAVVIVVVSAALIIASANTIDVMAGIQNWINSILEPGIISETSSANIIPFSLGIIGASWIIVNMVNAVVAIKLLANFKLNLRPPLSLADWHVPNYWDIPLIIGILIFIAPHLPINFGLSENFVIIGKTIVSLSSIPLFIIGLHVIYLWLMQFKNSRFLFNVIVVIAFFLVWPALLIVGLGVLEPWYGLRQRVGQKHIQDL